MLLANFYFQTAFHARFSLNKHSKKSLQQVILKGLRNSSIHLLAIAPFLLISTSTTSTTNLQLYLCPLISHQRPAAISNNKTLSHDDVRRLLQYYHVVTRSNARDDWKLKSTAHTIAETAAGWLDRKILPSPSAKVCVRRRSRLFAGYCLLVKWNFQRARWWLAFTVKVNDSFEMKKSSSGKSERGERSWKSPY